MDNSIKIEIGGKEKECSIVTTFEFKKDNYIAFLNDEEDEILIYKYIELDEGNINLLEIEDLEWESVIKVFNSLIMKNDEKV